ncbi:hypothetical protein OT109_12650 [Phycisphaeraceae bacterium D3-23]
MKHSAALLVCLLLLVAGPVSGQWQGDGRPLTMAEPAEWTSMSDALLADTNRQVRHVTGGNFIAGWAAYDSEVLLFPYLLVQHVPYTTLDETDRPTHRLDERGMMQLIGRLVRSLNTPEALPDDINLLTFSETYGSDQVRLVHLESGGAFVLTGTIPLGDGSGEIDYHTSGVLGREGAAFATVFSIEGLDLLRPAIDGAAETLAFTEGADWDALPERDPGVVGFLPPADEPLPQDAVLVGDGRFGFVPAQGFFPMSADRFDPRAELMLNALPEALREVSFGQVLTRTPASRRVSHPWAASAFLPWSAAGIEGPLVFQLTKAQWASVLGKLTGLDDATLRGWLGEADQDPARAEIAGEVQGDASPWVLVSALTARGRLEMKQSAMLDGEQMTRRLTLVMGVDGLAVFVSQAYADADGDEVSALQRMSGSMRFAGGGRLVDVPPAGLAQDGNTPGEQGGGEGNGPGEEGGSSDAAPTPDPNAAPTAPTESATDSNSAALPYVLGGLGLVFVGVVVIVVITTHQKAARQREKARARRERREAQ